MEARGMATLYAIKDWDEIYENNRTRELKVMQWVPVPAKLDGDGYTEIMDSKNGGSIYGAWIACVIVASRCDPRGVLMRARNVPHCVTSLARITRHDARIIKEMLNIAVNIGWVTTCEIPQEGARISQEGALKGREGKGRESNTVARAVDESFAQFWQAYPKRNGRRLGKAKADKIWNKMTDEDRALCLLATENLAKSGQLPKDPTRWLAGGKDAAWREWLDEPEPNYPDTRWMHYASCYSLDADNNPVLKPGFKLDKDGVPWGVGGDGELHKLVKTVRGWEVVGS